MIIHLTVEIEPQNQKNKKGAKSGNYYYLTQTELVV